MYSKKFQRRNTFNHGLVIANIVLFVVAICAGVLYLTQTNGLVGCSYEIREYKTRLEGLEAENQELEMRIAQWQSPANLERMLEKLNLDMVEVSEMMYIKGEGVVAMTP